MSGSDKGYFEEEFHFINQRDVFLKREYLQIIMKNEEMKLFYTDIKNTIFVFPFFLLAGKLIIEDKSGNRSIFRVSGKESEEYQVLKHSIDRYCKINAYEESEKFIRAPFISSFSVSNIMTLLIIMPLIVLHIIIGIALCFVKGIGVFIGFPIIIIISSLGIVIFRASIGAIEGGCPICGNVIKTNKNNRDLYCLKCKEKIIIKDNYFEY